jgi:hypothetical protein
LLKNVEKSLVKPSPTFNTAAMTATAIDEMIEGTMRKIAEAAGKRDLTAVTALTRNATELEEMKKTVQAIEAKLNTLKDSATVLNAESLQAISVRELVTEVTQGMLNQNLLTLTEHVKRGRIRTGEELLFEALPSGDRFRTDLMTNGNKLRERGAIARFYREAGVRAGDFVVLTEVAPAQWTLKKAPRGQFQSRMDRLLQMD